MAKASVAVGTATLSVTNIGGIAETTVELSPDVTVLTGRNATNRTSLLQAIMAALGSDTATLKGDADHGKVELTIEDTTYTRELYRKNGAVVTEGTPYLEDSTLADLFSFLPETNEARQAIGRGDDLHDIIMRPIDTTEIEDEIETHRRRRDEIDSQIDEIDQLKQKLPNLEEEISEIENRIEEKNEELAEYEQQIEDIDREVEKEKKEREQFENTLDQLNEARNELESIREQIETQRDSLNALEEEREELRSDRENYDEVQEDEIQEIEDEIRRLQNRKDDLNSTINKIQTVVEFNEGFVDGDFNLFQESENASADITDQLLEDEQEITCWTCGSETTTESIKSMLTHLRELRDKRRESRTTLNEEIDDLNDRRRTLEKRDQQLSRLQERLDTVNSEIEEREIRVAELENERDDLIEQVEALEAEVEELQTEHDQDSELLDLHKEANRIEVEIDRLKNDRERIEKNVAEIEDRIAEREQLVSQREEIQSEIENLRTRVDRLEENAVDEFNDHMESVLEILDYENIERVWIDRVEREVRQGRQKVQQSQFDLHVVRSTDSGSVYEDTIDHLSESEREVVGLVFALSGYLVHEVYEEVPFMLVDSIEAIDSYRIADIVDYFSDYADYLVVALLEEDAQALDNSYNRITEI